MSIKAKLAATTLAALALGAVVSLASNEAFANTRGPAPHPGGATPPPVPGHRAPGGTAGQGPAGGTYHPGKLVYRGGYYGRRFDEYCYWLPTVSNGSVSGLKPVCYVVRE